MFVKDETEENFKNENLELSENELNELMQFLEIIAELAIKKYYYATDEKDKSGSYESRE